MIELFLVSTVISQLALNFCSSFSTGLGTSMAENIPFVHTIANGICIYIENDGGLSEKILPTVLVAVALSTILNGVLFYLVGYFKIGNVLHYFPRYVIIGMTAGFGVFLISTAFEICTQMPFTYDVFGKMEKNMYMQLGIVFAIIPLLVQVKQVIFSFSATPLRSK